jgi:hypothetical protein
MMPTRKAHPKWRGSSGVGNALRGSRRNNTHKAKQRGATSLIVLEDSLAMPALTQAFVNWTASSTDGTADG